MSDSSQLIRSEPKLHFPLLKTNVRLSPSDLLALFYCYFVIAEDQSGNFFTREPELFTKVVSEYVRKYLALSVT